MPSIYMPHTSELTERFAGLRAENCRPWPRAAVTNELWQQLAIETAEGRWTLLALWGDKDAAHMALLDVSAGTIVVATNPCTGGHYPSVAQYHPPAMRLERALRDLTGLVPDGLPDDRPWLDHGTWGVTHPLGAAPQQTPAPRSYAFLPAEGESLHQIAVGPVHAGIIEPGHFRFTANGEAVVRLEERLGYVHKGTESLMSGASLDKAAQLAGRISGDSTVAYALACARAVEAALGIEAPPRARYLRALCAELERLANHFGDIGAICNDAAFALMLAHCGILRERVLRAAEAAFGHRLMMDCIKPGGMAVDLSASGIGHIKELLAAAHGAFPRLVSVYDNTASLQDRTVGTGRVAPALARQYGAGGFVGRASGRDFDTRRDLAYAPYDTLNFGVPLLEEGDVNARIWIRIHEVEHSLALIDQILAELPGGEISAEAKATGSVVEGAAIVEGFRGDIFAFVRLDEAGKIARCHMRDPSWFQWPLLEAAIEGNIVADFPLCNKSFNCSYSGHDL